MSSCFESISKCSGATHYDRILCDTGHPRRAKLANNPGESCTRWVAHPFFCSHSTQSCTGGAPARHHTPGTISQQATHTLGLFTPTLATTRVMVALLGNCSAFLVGWYSQRILTVASANNFSQQPPVESKLQVKKFGAGSLVRINFNSLLHCWPRNTKTHFLDISSGDRSTSTLHWGLADLLITSDARLAQRSPSRSGPSRFARAGCGWATADVRM